MLAVHTDWMKNTKKKEEFSDGSDRLVAKRKWFKDKGVFYPV